MSRQDLTNMHFGRWTVMYKATSKPHLKWHCKCECGNEKDVRDCHLKSGKSQSCGCLSRELASKRNLEDLTGLKFGRLKVLERTENYCSPKGEHQTKWRCICDCGKEVNATTHDLKSGHTKSCGCYNRERLWQSHKKYNDYEIQEDYVIMYTFKNEIFLVDLDDFWRVRKYCWCKNKQGYLLTRLKKGKNVLLSRYIMDCPDEMDVDHKNGTTSLYDNRKENLRIATTEQNSQNRALHSNNKSGVTGVNWDKQKNKWQAYITVNKKRIHLGFFNDIENAIKVRKDAEDKYFGEYSYSNSRFAAYHEWAKNKVAHKAIDKIK